MSVLVRDVISQAGLLAEGIDPTPGFDRSQWGQEDYFEATNWALVQVARAGTWTRKLLVYDFANDHELLMKVRYEQDDRIIPSPTPIAFLGVTMRPNNLGHPRTLYESTIDKESIICPEWRTKPGTPRAWMLEGGTVIYLNRMPSEDFALDVEVLEAPAVVTDLEATFDARIPDQVLESLRFGAAAFLLAQAGDNQDLDKADGLMEQFRVAVGLQKPIPRQLRGAR